MEKKKKKAKKGFIGVTFSCYSEQSPTKARKKSPLDLGKHEGASSVSLCYCPAQLVFGSVARGEAVAENP